MRSRMVTNESKERHGGITDKHTRDLPSTGTGICQSNHNHQTRIHHPYNSYLVVDFVVVHT